MKKLLISCLLMFSATIAGAADSATPDKKFTPRAMEGCFVSRPYKADVHDSFRVSRTSASEYEVYMHTVACGYTVSPDCSNATFEEIQFRSKFLNGKLLYREKNSSCLIEISFRSEGIAVVTQREKCEGFKYWGPHGIYSREEPGKVLTACKYEN